MPTMTSPASLKNSDLLTLATLDAAQIEELFITAAATKRDISPYRRSLDGKTIILLFEKPSLRTRVTFEVGPGKMGAKTIFFDHSKERVGAREAVKDYGRNLERWVDCIVARVFSQDVLEELAANCDVPVINALSDSFHPCQALADYFTLCEKLGGKQGVKAGLNKLKGFKLAYIGDGNNVCASLMHGAAKLGVHLTVICPKGYQPEPAVLDEARAMAGNSGATITVTHDPGAVKGAQAVYTDTWVSMGDEAEKVKRMGAFAKFRVDEKLMEQAANGSGAEPYFMHCLPAHRGAEVTDAVIDAPTSIVYDQAENRMHVQNALLLHMLGGV
jgi:ornithine carbamoyltransferase